jgi:hypothetical protein
MTYDNGIKEDICVDCHNDEESELIGIDNFTDYPRMLKIEDTKGKIHVFAIIKRVHSHLIQWEAMEIKNGVPDGFNFDVMDELDKDQKTGFERLKQIVEKHVKTSYVKEDGYITTNEVIGRIVRTPESNYKEMAFVIDGKNYTVEQLLKMLSPYEGWNFKLQMFDDFNEVERI